MRITRRQMLQMMAASSVGSVLAACAAPAGPGAEVADSDVAAPASAATELIFWIHWGGETGERAHELVARYNEGQGAEDTIQVNIEHVPGPEYRQKMTASRLAGTPADVYHTSLPIMELVFNEVVAELPDDEQAYVRENYIDAAIERMTFEGKIWGYPTEHQAPALIYRRSILEEFGIAPPTTTQEARELARQLTHDADGLTYYGFTQWYDNYPATFHFPGIVWRHGGELWTFDGDVPLRMNLDDEDTIAAVNWWRGFADDGVTQIGEMPFVDAWQNGLAIMGEIEPWFPFINLRDAGVEDIYEDLGVVHVPPAEGVAPVVQSGGWELIHDRSSANPFEAVQFMQWMMHKPDMPFARFIVEIVGSLPAPTDYPTPIPGWSEAMIDGYAGQTAPITRMDPGLKVLGTGEITQAVRETMEGIMLGQREVEPSLLELQVAVDEILERTDGHRWS